MNCVLLMLLIAEISFETMREHKKNYIFTQRRSGHLRLIKNTALRMLKENKEGTHVFEN